MPKKSAKKLIEEAGLPFSDALAKNVERLETIEEKREFLKNYKEFMDKKKASSASVDQVLKDQIAETEQNDPEEKKTDPEKESSTTKIVVLIFFLKFNFLQKFERIEILINA